ncbi:hypothetical protein [Marinobacter sp. P4B1]|uniref:hypothetical protein n=1 Tax=Marinobacter sp. P4B1 TaxID=1119533 RepID=UPI00071C3155|nr:hypothetical protein [Marinobacter sp. P4B1]KRW83754.1 hypothetical protein AQ621_17035 [Marinobacter sp. P4B1]
MFFKKSTKELADTNRGAKNSMTAKLPGRFRSACPDAGGSWSALYELPAMSLQRRVQNVDGGGNGLSRYEWQTEIATEAMIMIDKRPLQALVGLHGEHTYDFHRAAYLRGLVAGLGAYLRAGALLVDGKKPFHPALTDWPDRDIKWVKDRPVKPEFKLAPGICEYRIAQQIGAIEMAEKLDPSVLGYFLDSFDVRPSSKNPIVVSLLEAENKVSKVLALNGEDTRSIPKLMDVSSVIESSITEEVVAEPKEKVATPPVIQESPAPAEADQTPVAVEEAAPLSVSGEDILKLIMTSIPQGVVTVNDTDSMLCEVEGTLALVFPRATRMLAEMLHKPEEEIEAMIVRDLTDEADSYPAVDYRIQRKGRGWGKIRLKKLKPEYASQVMSVLSNRKPAPEIKRR